MRPTGSPEVLEYRRRLAIERIHDGYSAQEVAGFLGVDPSSIRRWLPPSAATAAMPWRLAPCPVARPS